VKQKHTEMNRQTEIRQTNYSKYLFARIVEQINSNESHRCMGTTFYVHPVRRI